MDAREPVVPVADSGTGKSHLLIGLGLAACEQGRRVRYVTSAQLVKRTRNPVEFLTPEPGRGMHPIVDHRWRKRFGPVQIGGRLGVPEGLRRRV